MRANLGQSSRTDKKAATSRAWPVAFARTALVAIALVACTSGRRSTVPSAATHRRVASTTLTSSTAGVPPSTAGPAVPLPAAVPPPTTRPLLDVGPRAGRSAVRKKVDGLLTFRGNPSRTFYGTGPMPRTASVVIDDDGMLYVASEFERDNARSKEVGQIMKLDPSKPDDPIVWSIPARSTAPSGVWATPALAGDLVIVVTDDGMSSASTAPMAPSVGPSTSCPTSGRRRSSSTTYSWSAHAMVVCTHTTLPPMSRTGRRHRRSGMSASTVAASNRHRRSGTGGSTSARGLARSTRWAERLGVSEPPRFASFSPKSSPLDLVR